MEFFLNNKSLHNQFNSIETFKSALHTIFNHRSKIESFGHRLSVRRDITQRLIHSNLTFQSAISKISDPTLKRSILSWLDKTGPFLDYENQKHSPDDFFWLIDEIITEDVLAEAAFRKANDEEVATVSFSPSDFEINPIQIRWDRYPESELIDVPNFWDQISLTEFLEDTMAIPDSWAGYIKRWTLKFNQLTFLNSVYLSLEQQPLSNTIARRIEVLLGVLQQYKLSLGEDDSLNAKGRELAQNYFERELAIFTDESESNKTKFRKELTFQLPDGSNIFCPFHGKIKTSFYRIHHSWPPRFSSPLVIAYIGPKITKS